MLRSISDTLYRKIIVSGLNQISGLIYILEGNVGTGLLYIWMGIGMDISVEPYMQPFLKGYPSQKLKFYQG